MDDEWVTGVDDLKAGLDKTLRRIEDDMQGGYIELIDRNLLKEVPLSLIFPRINYLVSWEHVEDVLLDEAYEWCRDTIMQALEDLPGLADQALSHMG